MNARRSAVVVVIGSDLTTLRAAWRAAGLREGKDGANEVAALRLPGEDIAAVCVAERDVRRAVEIARRESQAAVFTLAADLVPDDHEPPAKAPNLKARLAQVERTIVQTHGALKDAVTGGHWASPAAQWLLDNSHVLRAHIAMVLESMPPRMLQTVPLSDDGLPAAASMARSLVGAIADPLPEAKVEETIQGAQVSNGPLLMDELSLLPALVRLHLVEFLAQEGRRVRVVHQLREAAYFWANRLSAAFRYSVEEGQRVAVLLQQDAVARQPSFLVSVAEQLQDDERALAAFRALAETLTGTPLANLAAAEHQAEAQQGVRIAGGFQSLRTLSSADFTQVFEKTSEVEKELRRDPARVYGRSDEETRHRARRAVHEISRSSGRPEWDCAKAAVGLAAEASPGVTVLLYLLDEGRQTLESRLGARPGWRRRLERGLRRRAAAGYLFTIAALTLAFSLVMASLSLELGAAPTWVVATLWLLALFPLSDLAIQLANMLVMSVFPASGLPKMDFRHGIPAEHATLVAVPMIATGVEAIQDELDKLEIRYLANPLEHLWFALLSDPPDATSKDTPEDENAVAALRSGIEALNAKYPGGRFVAFHRGRQWSESEERWIGRERKRGKIEDLNEYLLGNGERSLLLAGTMPLPIRYVITLDADTQLPPNAARRLIETIAHPLNRVALDPETGVRRRGYAIVQPRVSTSLPGATATRFTRIAGDAHGTDPYCRLVSDSQQDLFGHAIFHGKAIYDVTAFHQSLHGRFPRETILSHDLIEGAHCGVGLATDIELFESMPEDYASYSRRLHRWIRGDWQIAPWILPRVPAGDGAWRPNPLAVIDRWRILDNLRRSLVPPASVALLLGAWSLSSIPALWTIGLVLAAALPALAILLDRLALRLQGFGAGGSGSFDALARAAVSLVFLPHQAWLAMDAICRALYRMTVSRRGLLEWQTADSAGKRGVALAKAAMRQLTAISGLSAAAAVWQAWMRHGSAMPLLVLWSAAPFLMQWLGGRVEPELFARIDRGDRRRLGELARRTWRFFDDLVGPQTYGLPPDNTQLALRVEVAARTSPTNIGLWLNAAQAAHDFGYLTADELCARCTHTMTTLEGLEKFEGHLLNWYSIATLEPLPPRYVSTVDSGNLIASLWVLRQGCDEMLDAPPIAPEPVWQGLADTFGNLGEAAGREATGNFEFRALRRLLRQPAPPFDEFQTRIEAVATLARRTRDSLAGLQEDALYWADRLCEQADAWLFCSARYYSWRETLFRYPDSTLLRMGADLPALRQRAVGWRPSLSELAGGPGPLEELLRRRARGNLETALATWLDDLRAEFDRARVQAKLSADAWRDLGARTSRLAQNINMGALFDPRKKLFVIGHLVGGPTEFTSHYDLLASECRLASLAAIAKGDVPQEHWWRLGRPRTPSPSGQTLLSWGGTMFEYLMPMLFVKTYPNSLLEHACRDAVLRQRQHGERQSLPWGVSESAYSAIDSGGTYQYHAFGIPELSLRGGASELDRVVAPYATALALQVDPEAAIGNLATLERMGLEGPMGFYEAIDFTRQPTPESGPGVVIYCYMAHHQAMSLLAIGNLLHNGATQRRFHRDFRVRAIESLLFERVPISPIYHADDWAEMAPSPARAAEEPPERVWNERTGIPRAQFFGNGRFSGVVTNSGGGYSRWKNFDISRWRSDAAADAWGSFVLLRDAKASVTWSATYQPLGGELGTYSATFLADRAEFDRRVLEIESNLQIAVSPEDDAEVRWLSVTNWSSRPRTIDVTSFLELALAEHAADRAHPAFAKMFVETACPERGLLTATRRKRSPDEPEIWAGHMVVGATGAIWFETDREQFLGRGNTLETAAAHGRSLTNTAGAVIDPIFSLRCRLHLKPGGREELGFVTMAAESREALLKLAARFRRPQALRESYELVWNRSQLDLRYLRIGPEDAHRFRHLGSALLYPDPNLRGPADRIARDRLSQVNLWGAGISGDLPILTATVSEEGGLGLLRELLLAHHYLRTRGMRFDLVVLNTETASYDRPLRQRIRSQVEALAADSEGDQSGGVHVRDASALPEPAVNQLVACAHVYLRASRGGLSQQLGSGSESAVALHAPPAAVRPEEPSPPLPFLELPYFNGVGGFTADGREYAIYLAPGSVTPAPWANVMAHETFGALVTEGGLGFTWCGNSQSNRLTTWHNDPVSDPQPEAIYLRDEESGARWSPTPLPIREQDAYRARHGQGYTVFEHNSHAIGQELTVFVPVHANGKGEPVKVYRLRLRNDSSRERRLTATFLAELVLGSTREEQQLRISTSYDAACGAVFAAQWWNAARAGATAFAASSPKPDSHSGDRLHFLGRLGSAARPDALKRIRLDNRTGPGLDPAAALQVSIALPRGGETEVIFLLGQCESADACRALIERFGSPARVSEALAQTQQWWNSVLDVITVRTPVLSVDLLMNRWLLYQALSCRFWGRSAFYQCGGAIGFRDQLQDSLALLYAVPGLARRHMLTAASHQFEQGDVQHWWHADTGLGMRTRCSDDLLWLPFAVARYVEVTGDAGVLEEQVGYLAAPELEPGEQEKMFVPSASEQSGSLREHCLRAIRRASQFGPHGLPLIGNGDWNDGMNRVGTGGRGESVWLAWFLCEVLDRFAALLEQTGTAAGDEVREFGRERASIVEAIEQHCWDGAWYLRAFFDGGETLGSARNAEARIDSLPQSWSVLAGAGDPARARRAVESARELLVDRDHRMVKLLTPPFDSSVPHPGYIMGYPPGMRENGGQYTHGSLWLAMAFARLQDGEQAAFLLQAMNPVELTRTPAALARYRGEPYAVAADVSAAPGRTGRSGWTWYTGSAAWMYRVWVEGVLGIRVAQDQLEVQPALPADWDGFQFSYRFGSSVYNVDVRVDAEADSESGVIPLKDDGQTRSVRIAVARRAGVPPAEARVLSSLR